MKSQFPLDGGNYSILIKNGDGIFNNCIGETYKQNYENKESFAIKDLPTIGEIAEYELSNASVKNIPCYKITKRVKLNSAAFENYKKFLPEWYVRKHNKELEREFKQHFPTVQIYYVDREMILPRKYEFYNAGGEKVYDFAYDGIELLKEVDNKFFKIPNSSSVKFFYTPDEVGAFLDPKISKLVQNDKRLVAIRKAAQEKEKRKNGPGISDKIYSYADTNFDSMTSILATVLFWVAMGLFAFAGIYKWKNRKHIESASKRAGKLGSLRKK